MQNLSILLWKRNDYFFGLIKHMFLFKKKMWFCWFARTFFHFLKAYSIDRTKVKSYWVNTCWDRYTFTPFRISKFIPTAITREVGVPAVTWHLCCFLWSSFEKETESTSSHLRKTDRSDCLSSLIRHTTYLNC